MSNKRATLFPLVDASASWDGEPLPAYPADAPRIAILRGVVPPHARLEMHRHPVINAGVVLRGELMVVAADGADF